MGLRLLQRFVNVGAPKPNNVRANKFIKRIKLALTPSFIDMAGDIPDVAEPLEYNPYQRLKAVLDLNDPYLLVDVRKPDEMRRVRRIGGEFIRQKINKDLTQRYNISNDE